MRLGNCTAKPENQDTRFLKTIWQYFGYELYNDYRYLNNSVSVWYIIYMVNVYTLLNDCMATLKLLSPIVCDTCKWLIKHFISFILQT